MGSRQWPALQHQSPDMASSRGAGVLRADAGAIRRIPQDGQLGRQGQARRFLRGPSGIDAPGGLAQQPSRARKLCRRRLFRRAHLHFTNAKGETALVKYKAIPDAGELGLSDDEADAKGPNFYEDEMEDRLAKGPVTFELVAIRGRDGDPTNDPTLRWDDEDARETAPLGKVSIATLAPSATCDAFSFLPGNVADGIAGPANDPVFQARSGAYIVSFTRRKAP